MNMRKRTFSDFPSSTRCTNGVNNAGGCHRSSPFACNHYRHTLLSVFLSPLPLFQPTWLSFMRDAAEQNRQDRHTGATEQSRIRGEQGTCSIHAVTDDLIAI